MFDFDAVSSRMRKLKFLSNRYGIQYISNERKTSTNSLGKNNNGNVFQGIDTPCGVNLFLSPQGLATPSWFRVSCMDN